MGRIWTSRFRAIIRVSLCLVAAVTLGNAQQANHASLPFERGEELIYQAEFTRALLRGVDVGEFHFTVSTPNPNSNTTGQNLQLIGDVVSKGLFPRIAGFRFHTHVESVVDPEQFTALHTSKLDEQGKRVRSSEAVFDHERRKVTWTERDPNQSQAARVNEVDFTEPIQDVLTMIYFLRIQNLEPGKSFEVPLTDSGRVYRFSINVKERKRIKTAVGNVSALRVEPFIFGDNGLIKSRGSLSIWVSEDSRHLPVKAQLKIELGTFDITLRKVSYREANH